LRDLEEIWDFIAKGKPEAADHPQEQFFEAVDGLATTPGKGHTREDLTDLPVRFFPLRSYLMVYRTQPAPVQIVAVIDAVRDVPTVLKR